MGWLDDRFWFVFGAICMFAAIRAPKTETYLPTIFVACLFVIGLEISLSALNLDQFER